MASPTWINAQPMEARKFTCGYCGVIVGADKGYWRQEPPTPLGQPTPAVNRIYVSPHCNKPSVFLGDMQVPGAAFGSIVEHLPPDVEMLYSETRNCITVSAYTASALACRKLLMNVAVAVGAPENDNFQNYVKYLADNGYVPPSARSWIDHIRNKGNEATHEIPQTDPNDAEDLITFMEMILRLVFEFPNRIPRTAPPATGAAGA
jgi:hypothetical protein